MFKCRRHIFLIFSGPSVCSVWMMWWSCLREFQGPGPPWPSCSWIETCTPPGSPGTWDQWIPSPLLPSHQISKNKTPPPPEYLSESWHRQIPWDHGVIQWSLAAPSFSPGCYSSSYLSWDPGRSNKSKKHHSLTWSYPESAWTRPWSSHTGSPGHTSCGSLHPQAW